MKTLTHTFHISDDAWKLLLSIQKEGYAEYRDTHGGTYHLTGELLKYNLITDVEDAWHITYKVTELAEDLIAIELRDEKITSVLNK